jgi:hypothetical protein
VGTEHTTVAGQRLQPLMAAYAIAKKLSGVSGHSRQGRTAARGQVIKDSRRITTAMHHRHVTATKAHHFAALRLLLLRLDLHSEERVFGLRRTRRTAAHHRPLAGRLRLLTHMADAGAVLRISARPNTKREMSA